MKNLARLQHTFQDCVLDSGNASSTAWVSASGRASPEIQLSIYTHAYRSRLTEVLVNDYPAVLMAIGEDQFNRLANDYIRAHPSHYFSLRDFGRHLPSFVAGLIQQDTGYREMPWLHELTLFEWTLGQAFDAADAPRLNEQDMSAILPQAWPKLRFILHPSVHRLDLEWNIAEMWRSLTDDNPIQVTAVRDTACPWLIWREQLVTRFRSMQIDEQRAFDAMLEARRFNEVCEVLAPLMNEDEVPLRIASLLKGWITQGLISGVE
jgi:hypothetical protein